MNNQINVPPIALITGITGQDGSYLAEELLAAGYEVHGTIRRSSSFNTGRIDHIFNKLKLHYADMTDNSICNLIRTIVPDVVYNLAAQSHVAVSFEIPEYTDDVNYMGVVRILDCIKRMKKPIKFYQASTSEMFGLTPPPQTEDSVFKPCSPYGIAKLAAHRMCVNYRESYDMFISCGILFNHESPRRGETFLTRKVSIGVSKIKLGLTYDEPILIGNIKAERDWGWAPEYVKGMMLMMDQDKPDDYILATGRKHTVQEFIEKAFNALDMRIYWTHNQAGEVTGARESTSQRLVVKIDPKYFRPLEVDSLEGVSDKAKYQLRWASKYNFDMIVSSMVRSDFNRLIKTI